jgi:peptidoglycan hydrolase-like protein with peptidoglycan-binding domain
VGRSVRVSVAVSWSTTRTLFAAADGVVTSVPHDAGDAAKAGDVLLTVNLEPLVVAEGFIPMFRTLAQGVEGPDVTQLQRLLRSLQFFPGPTNGVFGPATAAATKRWQRSIGATADGTVETGSLLFVDDLPAGMVVVPTVGARISAGSELVRVLADLPDFTVTVSGSQRLELTSGLAISIDAPGGGTWPGTLGSFEQLGDGRYIASLTGALCGDSCDRIPVDGETALSGQIVLVPDTSGVVVPVSTLVQQPSGALAVTLADGTSRSVRIVVEADGFAIVEGLDAGSIITLPEAPIP